MTSLHVEVEIHNDPEHIRPEGYVVPSPVTLSELVTFSVTAEANIGQWTVVVVLTSDDHLRQLHAQFMGIDEETDVMTFPYDSADQGSGQGGDIVISVDRAAENAKSFGVSLSDEIAFLTVHGTLHLCGWDDATTDAREKMLSRQQELIAQFGRERSAQT